jgi:hypothetical protein
MNLIIQFPPELYIINISQDNIRAMNMKYPRMKNKKKLWRRTRGDFNYTQNLERQDKGQQLLHF